ncbi:MAG: hypothetical protein K0R19_2653 [Bacillota bacterium]|nr:hypothetical protein [Bacillota bacterium]
MNHKKGIKALSAVLTAAIILTTPSRDGLL